MNVFGFFFQNPATDMIDCSEHVIMGCHFRLANQIQSRFYRVEKPSVFFHSAKQLEHNDISSVCSLSSHMFVLDENG